jgi:hypothetical protein
MGGFGGGSGAPKVLMVYTHLAMARLIARMRH